MFFTAKLGGCVNLARNIVLQSKVGFSPDQWRVLDCGSETLKGKPPLGSACNIGMWTARAWGFMLASHMCRFEDGLLLSSSWSLRMIEAHSHTLSSL